MKPRDDHIINSLLTINWIVWKKEKILPFVDPYAAKHMLFEQNSAVRLEVRGLLMSGNGKPATLVRLSRQCDFESFDCNLCGVSFVFFFVETTVAYVSKMCGTTISTNMWINIVNMFKWLEKRWFSNAKCSFCWISDELFFSDCFERWRKKNLIT